MKRRHSTKLFLELLKEVAVDVAYDGNYEPTDEFRRGVNKTIEMARIWFEANNVKEFDIELVEE